MIKVKIAEVEGRLTQLLSEVERGEEVIVTRDGEAIAQLSPVPQGCFILRK